MAAIIALVAAAPAVAQDIQSTIPANASLARRQNGDYDPIGGRIGSFLLYPTLSVSGTATDNVLATDTDKKADEYLTARPALRLTGGDLDRFANISGYLSHNFHAQLQREDTTEYGTAGYLRLGDLGSNRLELNFTADAFAVSRENISNNVLARSPIRRDEFEADLAYTQVFNRVSVSVAGTFNRSDFHNPTAYSGAIIDLSFRDYNAYRARTEVRYELVNGFRLVARGQYTNVQYDLSPGNAAFDPATSIDRNSYQVLGEAGIGASIEDKLYGEILLGYATSKADQRRSVDPSNGGISYNIDVLWNINPITTLKIQGARTFTQTNSPTLRGYRYTGGTVETDVALTPALLLAISARYLHIEPLGPSASRDEYGGLAQLTYHLSRRYSLTAGYRHSGRSANPGQQPFEANFGSVGFNVTL